MKILKSICQDELNKLYSFQQEAIKNKLVPPPVILIECDVFDIKTGKHISQYKDRSHTYVRNAYNLMLEQLCGVPCENGSGFGAGKCGFKNTSNAEYNGGSGKMAAVVESNAGGSYPSFKGAAGDVTRGIVIGIGVGAESFESYILGTLIAHGTGSGQMSYLAMPTDVIAYTAGTKIYENMMERTFNNDSGGTIVVSEIGLYASLYYHNGTIYEAGEFLLMRDLLSSTVSVENGQSFRARYKHQLTYPA